MDSLVPLSETTDIGLLEGVINDQTTILKTVYGEDVDVAQIPQIWTLCELILEGHLSRSLTNSRSRGGGILR